MFVSRWCNKSGPLKLIGQFSLDVFGCNARVKFLNSDWLVLVSFDPSVVSQIKSLFLRPFRRVCLCREYVVCKVQVAVDICSEAFVLSCCTSFPESVVENSLHESYSQ